MAAGLTLAGRAFADPARRLVVALIGDASRAELFGRLVRQLGGPVSSDEDGARRLTARAAPIDITCRLDGDEPGPFATQVMTADIALVAVDSTEGPRAEIREHLLIARQARATATHLILTNIEGLRRDAAEQAAQLLDAEISESKALAAAYLRPTAAPEVLFDAEMPGLDELDWPHGLADAARFLAILPKPQRPPRVLEPAHGARIDLYLLTDEERRGRPGPLQAGRKVQLWCEGAISDARMNGIDRLAPGHDGEVLFGFEDALPMAAGSGVLVIRDKAVIGVGVVRIVAAVAPAGEPP